MLIEDNEIDVMTVKRSLRDLKVTNQLVSTGDGEVQAIDRYWTVSKLTCKGE